ncbi:hypothetical protein NLU13_2492 [Sarocladium strictum]|uniref:Uncharacterized protein n=1 Tax=Sarocladium strictum TaxID=5046 RepID=A0AA39GK89_SARSR|nr:hypothetical protein NLU13_2492 [Sarocladium strictum]
MCTTQLYTERYPDGHREKSYRFERCNENRLGLPCIESASSSRSRTTGTQPTYAYADTYLPPTPSYTPVISTPVYRSGDDSDRSYHSASSAGRRQSGRYYVASDNQYLDVNPRSYRTAQRETGRRGAERVVIVDGPPTPRTPPQTFTFPHSAPSSPNFGHAMPHIIETSPRVRESTRRRPIIVDERPRPRVQIVEPSPERASKTHSRNGSADKSNASFTTTTTTSSSRDQERLERQRAEIARQNAEINSRPTVPVSRPLKRSTTYTRPSGAYDATAEVADSFARVDLNREQRREERARRVEDKAQQEAMDRRLRERLMPRRRATVGPGTRRHPVLYDDGLYRWE